MQKIDIVITAWLRENMSRWCIEAIKKNTTTPYRLIVIDNDSDRFTREFFLENAHVYVKLDRNRGLEYAKWLGMQFVESDLFVSTDNDILVYKYDEKDWLQRLIDLMNKYPEYGAIAPRPQVLVGTSMEMFNTDKEIVDFGHVPGYARIMRTEWVREVGAWNDKRPLRGHEELWIGEKFKDKGYKMAWAKDIECYHLFGDDEHDGWGYAKNISPENHGHNEVSSLPKNDPKLIFKKTGIKI